ncbi:hypothetical protein E4T56_gene4147 [Termitomyces sp. T112]|nr:hypothetical protein E4T56_gene4147 [Termitomyces sp. T112]
MQQWRCAHAPPAAYLIIRFQSATSSYRHTKSIGADTHRIHSFWDTQQHRYRVLFELEYGTTAATWVVGIFEYFRSRELDAYIDSDFASSIDTPVDIWYLGCMIWTLCRRASVVLQSLLSSRPLLSSTYEELYCFYLGDNTLILASARYRLLPKIPEGDLMTTMSPEIHSNRTTRMPAVILTYVAFILFLKKSHQKRARLPPGPPGHPFIGHVLKIPAESQDLALYKLGKTYGDVMYLEMFGRPIVVLNSVEAAIDLLDKRSANYSDRPHFPIFELMGWRETLTFTGSGKLFKKYRRLCQEHLKSTKIIVYQPMIA